LASKVLRISAMEIDARSLDQKKQAEYRRRAHILHKQGKSRQEIADILGVHLKTVDRWRANHKRMVPLPYARKSAVARSELVAHSGYALDSTDHNLSCLRDYFIRDWIDLGSLLGQA
jgi:hypothetical protein